LKGTAENRLIKELKKGLIRDETEFAGEDWFTHRYVNTHKD